MKIILNPQQTAFDTFVRSIPETFAKGGKTIYKQRNEIKVFHVNGIDVNVKRYKVPNFINRIAYTFFRSSKAERSYRYALKFNEKGIGTPEPIAFILTKKNGLIHCSYFISLQSPYEHTMYEFGQGEIAGREHIIRAFAGFTANLHEQGVCHKDYSPGNILFQERDGQVHFCLVDLNRMSLDKPVDLDAACFNFRRLWGSDEMIRFFVKEYAGIRNFDEASCLKKTFEYRKKFWNTYTKQHPGILPYIS